MGPRKASKQFSYTEDSSRIDFNRAGIQAKFIVLTLYCLCLRTKDWGMFDDSLRPPYPYIMLDIVEDSCFTIPVSFNLYMHRGWNCVHHRQIGRPFHFRSVLLKFYDLGRSTDYRDKWERNKIEKIKRRHPRVDQRQVQNQYTSHRMSNEHLLFIFPSFHKNRPPFRETSANL